MRRSWVRSLPATQKTMQALYRFINDKNELLYIGRSISPGVRFNQHRKYQKWWYEVSTITIEYYPDIDAVKKAEKSAIRQENPIYNIVYNLPTPFVTEDEISNASTEREHLREHNLCIVCKKCIFKEDIDGLPKNRQRRARNHQVGCCNNLCYVKDNPSKGIIRICPDCGLEFYVWKNEISSKLNKRIYCGYRMGNEACHYMRHVNSYSYKELQEKRGLFNFTN